MRGGEVVPVPVPVPGVVPLWGGMVDGGVVLPSGLVVVPGVMPGVAGVVVSGSVVPVVPEVPLVAGGVAGAVVAGVAVVLVSLCLLQAPSSAQTMVLPRTSLLVVRSGAVMIVPLQWKIQWKTVVETHASPDWVSETWLASLARFRAGGPAQVHWTCTGGVLAGAGRAPGLT